MTNQNVASENNFFSILKILSFFYAFGIQFYLKTYTYKTKVYIKNVRKDSMYNMKS